MFIICIHYQIDLSLAICYNQVLLYSNDTLHNQTNIPGTVSVYYEYQLSLNSNGLWWRRKLVNSRSDHKVKQFGYIPCNLKK